MIKEEKTSDESEEEDKKPDLEALLYSSAEIGKPFVIKYNIRDESTTSLQKDYILNMCCDDSFSRVACGLSNGMFHVFDINQNGLLPINACDIAESKTKYKISGVRFLDESPNSLLVGSENGNVKLFDLRTFNEEICFNAKAFESQKTITTFDRNSSSRILCAGCEHDNFQVHLFFFDIRKGTQMFTYTDSHSEDITAVRFHPSNPKILSTGCTAGLINIFDISQDREDEALTTTINTECSVYKLNWHKDDRISCVTNIGGYKMYNSDEGKSIVDFRRENIAEAIHLNDSTNLNLVNCHNLEDGNVFLLAGNVMQKGEILRSVLLIKDHLEPYGNFQGNKQIVRESCFDSKSNSMITAGESAIISLWSAGDTDLFSASSLKSDAKLLKAKTSSQTVRTHGKTPY